jgi:hypothetical protein
MTNVQQRVQRMAISSMVPKRHQWLMRQPQWGRPGCSVTATGQYKRLGEGCVLRNADSNGQYNSATAILSSEFKKYIRLLGRFSACSPYGEPHHRTSYVVLVISMFNCSRDSDTQTSPLIISSIHQPQIKRHDMSSTANSNLLQAKSDLNT